MTTKYQAKDHNLPPEGPNRRSRRNHHDNPGHAEDHTLLLEVIKKKIVNTIHGCFQKQKQTDYHANWYQEHNFPPDTMEETGNNPVSQS